MPTLCSVCFPSQADSGTKVDPKRELYKIVKNGKMFWIGYIVCDPKVFTVRKDQYDLHVEEIKAMNLDNLPVLYNHVKHRKPLGHVVLAWHDHGFPGSLFAIAFLAVITSRTILETPAAITLFGDTCPSLSTLKKQRTITTEVSITFCGARKGCLGMFVSGDKVEEKCGLFGLFDTSDRNCSYKHVKEEIQASFIKMTQQQGSGEKVDKVKSLEDILVSLQRDDYEQVLSHMNSNREALNIATQKTEDLNEAVGLLSDFMCSMIKTRLALEDGNDSDLAMKRKEDFQLLKERGVFEKTTTDTEAIQEMLKFCNQYFLENASSNKDGVSRVCQIFQKHFPELSDRLEQTQEEHQDTASTVDAAFNILNDEIKRKEMKSILESQNKAKNRLMDLASKQFTGLKKFSKVCISNNKSTGDVSTNIKGDPVKEMSLDIFLQKCGLMPANDDQADKSPVAKKRKRFDSTVTNKESAEQDDSDFINFALNLESKRKEAEKRYELYKEEYKRQKESKTNERQKQIESLIETLPKINEMLESIPEILAKELALKIPELVKMIDTSSCTKSSQLYQQGTEREAEQQKVTTHTNSDIINVLQPPPPDQKQPKEQTIDASVPLMTDMDLQTNQYLYDI